MAIFLTGDNRGDARISQWVVLILYLLSRLVLVASLSVSLVSFSYCWGYFNLCIKSHQNSFPQKDQKLGRAMQVKDCESLAGGLTTISSCFRSKKHKVDSSSRILLHESKRGASIFVYRFLTHPPASVH